MSRKYGAAIERHQIKIVVVLLIVLLFALGAAIFAKVMTPYAVDAQGTKIEQPWAVMLGGRELFTVEDQYTGQSIIKGIENYYVPERTNLQEVSMTPELTVVQKEFKPGEKKVTAVEPQAAVAQVIGKNQESTPILTVTTTETITKTKPVNYKTVYKEEDSLAKGKVKVKRTGTNGKKVIVSRVVKQNGQVVESEVIDSKIAKQPVDRVVKTGTGVVNKNVSAANINNVTSSTTTADTAPAQAATTKNSGTSSDSSNAAEDSASNSNNRNSGKTASTDNETRDDENSNNSSNDGNNSSSNDKNDKDKNDDDSKSDAGSKVVSYAKQFLGNPYVYGGTSLTNGADCSGFIMSVYKHFGYSLPHSSSALRSSGRGVSYSEAKPGDIICYSGHVGIYIGNGKIIHASTPSKGIIIGSATYTNILAVRRIIN